MLLLQIYTLGIFAGGNAADNEASFRSVSMILRHLPGEFSEQSIILAPWGLEG
jgi:hypothetical protein